jgi:hypothetical protein
LFRTRSSLAAEILVLRHQINVLRRHSTKRQTFSSADRLIFAWLYRLAPTVLNALAIVKPETVIKWHSAGFRSYWRWKSRRGGGRPTVPPKVRNLIHEMSIANPPWGAPRIHGELLKLGIEIGQTSVAKYCQATRPAVPRMEDIPPQSCRRHRSVRRADNLVSSALWTADRGARPTTDRMARRHSASDRRMDCKIRLRKLSDGNGLPTI